MNRVLILDDREGPRRELSLLLTAHGCSVVAADSIEQALGELGRRPYDAVFFRLASMEDPVERFAAIAAGPGTPLVIVVVEASAVGRSLPLVDSSAFDIVVDPPNRDSVALALSRASRFLRLRRNITTSVRPPAEALPDMPSFAGMVGSSHVMRRLFRSIEKAAASPVTVLITGESGTGKELVARALHDRSKRAAGPFVAINCGAIPSGLLESELFGHRKGSFSGAVRDKLGHFEVAHGGTLFLDEIGELPTALQVKLLRALQEGDIQRIGDTDTTRVDVRIFAATVRDLGRDVETGAFRQDLFYRLNVVPLSLPALRDRPDDIDLLVDHFLAIYGAKHVVSGVSMTDAARARLRAHSWPGNVRELQNAIERAVVLSDSGTIDVADFDKHVEPAETFTSGLAANELSIKKVSRRVERELIRRALEHTEGNRTNASKLLEISHRALLYKIKDFGL